MFTCLKKQKEDIKRYSTDSNMSETPSRPMKFPYTFSAKVAQFPYKFHFQYNWMVRYWVAGVILSIPVFYKIHKLSNSPENVRNFEEAKRKEEAARHHH